MRGYHNFIQIILISHNYKIQNTIANQTQKNILLILRLSAYL